MFTGIAIIAAAVIGAAATAYSEYSNGQAAAEAKAEANAAQEKLTKDLEEKFGRLDQDIQDHYSHEGQDPSTYANADDYTAYLESLRNSGMEQYIKDFYDKNELNKGFEYDKTLDDFYAKNRSTLERKAADAALHKAGNAGMAGSADAAEAIGTAVANKSAELQALAQNEYNADRNQSYTEWNSYLQQKQNELTNLLTGQQNDLASQKALADLYKSEQDSYWEDLMNERLAAINAETNAGVALQTSTNNTGNYSANYGNAVANGAAAAGAAAKAASYFD